MEREANFLLAVWREICRRIELDESLPALAAIVAERLPVDGLQVDLFEREYRLVRPLAKAAVGGATAGFPPTRQLSSAQASVVRRWAEGGQASWRAARDETPRELAGVLGSVGGGWIAMPLGARAGAESPSGALLLRLTSAATIEPRGVALVERLADPFATALANDRRVAELKALRDESEADRQSMLATLGRDDIIEIIGHDGGLSAVMRRVELVATSDVPVLLLGETGAGKEVMARAIHERSARAKGPFIRVNCGAIPSELVDSELFGHEKGAFTGATSSRRGWFERADRGTLLLDEIAELPLPAQVRLLRVLQEGVFERVGGERSIRVDVRIVAATHRDLPAMVRQGRFREDLWYRITSFPVLIPPLRDRREDIPALVHHFVERAAHRWGRRPLSLSAADLELLTSYDWPGNIRELGSVIERAAILGAGETLEVAKALGANLLGADDGSEPASRETDPATRLTSLRTLDEITRRHIESALRATGGRIEGRDGVARSRAINPHTLRARMRKLGIDWSRFRASRSEPDGQDMANIMDMP